MALALAVKAMKDSMGPEGRLPSALVFGEFLSVETRSELATER